MIGQRVELLKKLVYHLWIFRNSLPLCINTKSTVFDEKTWFLSHLYKKIFLNFQLIWGGFIRYIFSTCHIWSYLGGRFIRGGGLLSNIWNLKF